MCQLTQEKIEQAVEFFNQEPLGKRVWPLSPVEMRLMASLWRWPYSKRIETDYEIFVEQGPISIEG